MLVTVAPASNAVVGISHVAIAPASNPMIIQRRLLSRVSVSVCIRSRSRREGQASELENYEGDEL